MYGCELWNLSCNYIKDYKVAWREKLRGESGISRQGLTTI